MQQRRRGSQEWKRQLQLHAAECCGEALDANRDRTCQLPSRPPIPPAHDFHL